MCVHLRASCLFHFASSLKFACCVNYTLDSKNPSPIPGHRTNKGIKMAIHKGERGAFPL